MTANLEAGRGVAARRGSPTTETAREILVADLERQAVQAQAAMARVRRALTRLDTFHGGDDFPGDGDGAEGRSFRLRGDSALARLADATRGAFDMEDALDLLLAARSTLDALRESAGLVEMLGALVTRPASGPEKQPTTPTATVASCSRG